LSHDVVSAYANWTGTAIVGSKLGRFHKIRVVGKEPLMVCHRETNNDRDGAAERAEASPVGNDIALALVPLSCEIKADIGRGL